LSAFFFAAYGLFAAFGGIPLWVAVLVFLFFCSLFVFSEKIFTSRFSPLPILARSSPGFSFFAPALPFILAALVSLFFAPFLPGAGSARNTPYSAFIITGEEYREHLAFQAAFSYRPLGRDRAEDGGFYPAYARGEDGLPVPGEPPFTESPPPLPPEAREFPLKHLMDFLGKR
jgi:hypothetical protein